MNNFIFQVAEVTWNIFYLNLSYIVILGIVFFLFRHLSFTFHMYFVWTFISPFLFGVLFLLYTYFCFPFSIWNFASFLDFFLIFLTNISLFAQIVIWSWISSKVFICINNFIFQVVDPVVDVVVAGVVAVKTFSQEDLSFFPISH